MAKRQALSWLFKSLMWLLFASTVAKVTQELYALQEINTLENSLISKTALYVERKRHISNDLEFFWANGLGYIDKIELDELIKSLNLVYSNVVLGKRKVENSNSRIIIELEAKHENMMQVATQVKLILEPNDQILHTEFKIQNYNDKQSNSVYPLATKGLTFVRSFEHENWQYSGHARVTLIDKNLFIGSIEIFDEKLEIYYTENGLYASVKKATSIAKCAQEPIVMHNNQDMNKWSQKFKSLFAGDWKNTQTSHFSYRNGQDRSISFLFPRDDTSSFGNSSSVSRDSLAKSVGSQVGCYKERKVAYIGVVTDCNFSAKKSQEEIKSSVIDTFNQASRTFEKAFNISLGLLTLYISSNPCPQTPSNNEPYNYQCGTLDASEILSKFAIWAGRQNKPDNIAGWVLFGSCQNSSGVAGIADLNTICTKKNDEFGSRNIAYVVNTDYRVVAHEIGHVFGLVHDCSASVCRSQEACCPRGPNQCSDNNNYIMNPVLSADANDFSPCSIGQLCTSIKKQTVLTSCLTDNSNVAPFENAVCGNGIVEAGEDCDCGGEIGCRGNKCCDPKTCKFLPNAVCDDSNGACCQDCQFKPNNTQCRPSTGECDVEQFCQGNSSHCPGDNYKPDGTSCGAAKEGLYCASGTCTSIKKQCQEKMPGSSGGCPFAKRSCFLSCEKNDMCYLFQITLRDGTECGEGGRCYRGHCNNGSLGHQINSWFKSRKVAVIIAAVFIGLILLAILTKKLIFWLQNKQSNKKKPRYPYMPPPPYSSRNPNSSQYYYDMSQFQSSQVYR